MTSSLLHRECSAVDKETLSEEKSGVCLLLLQSDAEFTAQRCPGELSFTSFMDLLCRELKKLENALYRELFGDCGIL